MLTVKQRQKQTLLRSNFLNNSSRNYSETFQNIKAEQDKVKLHFKSQNNIIYNNDFNSDKLAEAIQLSHNSATGPDFSSIFSAEAKAVDLDLYFIRTCDTNNKFIIFSD